MGVTSFIPLPEEDEMEVKELYITSTIDYTEQPSLFFEASEKGRPLLVGLHTWSFSRDNQIKNMLPYAEKYDFNLLLPEFRGPNLKKNPRAREACGSKLAIGDIKDAIDYVVRECGVDRENVFLLGLSGGGHMALMMAGHYPEYFKAIGAFVPITDLKRWTEENSRYRDSVFTCCTDDEAELLARSPISYIDNIARANVKIFHGKYDPVVPVTHSLNLYTKIFEKYPRARVYLDIFNGGHEIDMQSAMYWIMSEYKGAKKSEVTG